MVALLYFSPTMGDFNELEKWYEREDPWGYSLHPDDRVRKEKILSLLTLYGITPEKTLDVGCGEGWLTKDLPGKLTGWDASVNAMMRFPENVGPWDGTGKFDLVVTTGTLYNQYDWRGIIDSVKRAASRWVLVAGVPGWIRPERAEFGKLIHSEEIAYRDLGNIIELYQTNL